VHKDKRLVIGPQVILDKERCINCTRCVRFCQEVSKTNQLVQVERGESTEITTFPGQEFTDPYSLCTVDLCPVGALTSSDFRFKKRVWWLQQTSSICPECERGCALTVDHADNSMFRLRPRYEPQVNNWWACDYGRLSYHKYSSDRIISGHFGLRTHEELSSSPADAAVAGGRWLREAATGSGRVGVWIDSCLSLEEGFAALSFAQRFAETSQVHLAQRASGSGDHLLRLPGEASNGRGLKVLAQHMGIELLSADNLFGAQQQWSALLGFGAEIELPRPSSPEQVGRVMLFAWRHNHVTKVAHTLVPIAGHFEKAGHYVNSQGIVQQAEAAVAPPAGVVSLATLLHAIASDHGIALDYRDETEAQSKALAAVNGEGGANG
jgi:NADH-quinone oxidoreductase subunit G